MPATHPYFRAVLPDAERATIVDTLRAAIPGVKAIYLFGSRAGAGEYAVADSDYDIGFYAGHLPTLGEVERFALAGRLAGELRAASVDLVDAGTVPDHFLRTQVIDGDRLWCDQTPEVATWEAKSLTMANDFYLSTRELREYDLRVIRDRHAARNRRPQE